jgi:hypothetical protein
MSGDADAPEQIDNIKKLMTPAQRAEAEKRASEW